ncbi:MAG: hypothetical protein R2844_10300 [Caldilineales bacterium]
MDEIDGLILEAQAASDRFWYVQSLKVSERTDATLTLHLLISDHLFVQIFFSNRSQRLSLALVGPGGRVYGRDREAGVWHMHRFEDADHHHPTPEGMSASVVAQFLAEVEEILVNNDLI